MRLRISWQQYVKETLSCGFPSHCLTLMPAPRELHVLPPPSHNIPSQLLSPSLKSIHLWVLLYWRTISGTVLKEGAQPPAIFVAWQTYPIFYVDNAIKICGSTQWSNILVCISNNNLINHSCRWVWRAKISLWSLARTAPAIRPITSQGVALNYYNYSLHIPEDAFDDNFARWWAANYCECYR